MIATRAGLLEMLPAYRDTWVLVNPEQDVDDIIHGVLQAHEEFAGVYDIIAPVFDYRSTEDICNALYNFCKYEIQYREEGKGEKDNPLQTIATPTGILTRGFGDCKHYAGFTAGILDALNRSGKNIDWCYRFASYRMDVKTPYHVFVVVNVNGHEKFIDATPGAASMQPIWIIDKKINAMPLVKNIAGVGEVADESIPDINSITQEDLEGALSQVDTSLDMDDATVDAINMLVAYQLIGNDAQIDNVRFHSLLNNLQEAEKAALTDAYNRYLLYMQSNAIGNFLDDLWRGTKVATLAIPRNAFLGLVALNVFGMASKMSRLLAIPDARKKLVDKWYSLGGKENGIVDAINNGAKKKAVLGGLGQSNSVGVAAAAAPAWLAVAGGIIAAIMPLVTSLLKQNNAYTSDFAAIDAGNYGGYGTGGGNFLDNIKNFVVQNPIPSAAAAALLLYLFVWKE